MIQGLFTSPVFHLLKTIDLNNGYPPFFTDRALSDICTTEDECKNKKHRVDDEIQKFVSKRKRKHRIDKPDYNVDKSSSNEADQTNTPGTHRTTARTHKEHTQRSIWIQKQQKPPLGKEIHNVPTIPKLLWWDFYSDGVSSKNDTITCKGGVKCHAVSNRLFASHPDTMVTYCLRQYQRLYSHKLLYSIALKLYYVQR
jgi:hypothetical protein